MPLIIQKARARWKGGGKRTQNIRVVDVDSGLLKRAKFSSGFPPIAKAQTAPSELIAAAHACSFVLSLSDRLGLKNTRAGEVSATVTVSIEHLASGWSLANVHLNVVARLPKITQEQFIEATVHAKTTCQISTMLHAHISMNAKLEK